MVLLEFEELKIKYFSYIIYLVGYSLGGVVVCFVVFELKVFFGYDNVIVIIFGEFWFGNYEFVCYVDEVFFFDEDVEFEKSIYC